MPRDSQPGSATPPEPVDPGAELPEPTREDLALETPAEVVPPSSPEGEAAGEDTEAARRYRDRWLRAEAELQNYRRRAVREREESERRAEESVLLQIIEQLDDLERALGAAGNAGAAGAWVEGVRLVAQKMRDTLSRYGVTSIETEGRMFDPEVHDAMLEVDPPAGVAPGSVVHVERPGYRRGGRVLRAARVVVARTAAERS